jgi:hypothetical protein
MVDQRNWKRIRERFNLKLPIQVYCKETNEFEWTEASRLIDVTPFGAGFTLKHPTEKGRLLQMVIPMPRQLRVFDHLELQYRIWAIVRHAKLVAVPNSNESQFQVGVAFIGKRPPASYEKEPWRRYEIIAGPRKLTNVIEMVSPLKPVDQRTVTRHNIAVDMKLETLDDNGNTLKSETTVTEDISKQGARIYTTLETQIGQFIRLSSTQYNLTLFAAVRGVSKGEDGIKRIHVEFIGREWPL